MRTQHASHALQTSALVNEAYLRLVDQRKARRENRARFNKLGQRLKNSSVKTLAPLLISASLLGKSFNLLLMCVKLNFDLTFWQVYSFR